MSDRFFQDLPISFDAHSRNLHEQIAKHDTLGIAQYAEALAEFIGECATPMTIGVQGDWGIGKTSTLNLIKSYLTSRRGSQGKHAIIWFNTWHYSLFNQDEFLGAVVINGILDTIRNTYELTEGPIQKCKSAITRVLKSVTASISVAGVSFDPTKLTEGDPTLEETLGVTNISTFMLHFKQVFQEVVQQVLEKAKAKRLIIFVDDLDRVKPVRALELLESLKNYLDVPHCVFVLAVDYEVIQVGMAEKLGQDIQRTSGKSFFDKIIQLPFTMPSNSYVLKEYIQNLLQESGFIGSGGIREEHSQFYADVTATSVGRNPRSIKRVINYAILLEKVRQRNASQAKGRVTHEDRMILYALICMQIAWPEIFEHFVRDPSPGLLQKLEDWEHIDSIPNIKKIFDRTQDVVQLKSNISAYADLLFELVDENNDGTISQKEFQRVFRIMKITKLTVVDDYRDPVDVLLARIKSNDSNDSCGVGIRAFLDSRWYSGSNIDYKISGSRYATVVLGHRQIGTVVSTKGRPFLLRLDASWDALLDKFSDGNGKAFVEQHLKHAEGRMTGFGDVYVDFYELEQSQVEEARVFLNTLFDAMSAAARTG